MFLLFLWWSVLKFPKFKKLVSCNHFLASRRITETWKILNNSSKCCSTCLDILHWLAMMSRQQSCLFEANLVFILCDVSQGNESTLCLIVYTAQIYWINSWAFVPLTLEFNQILISTFRTEKLHQHTLIAAFAPDLFDFHVVDWVAVIMSNITVSDCKIEFNYFQNQFFDSFPSFRRIWLECAPEKACN